MTTNLDPTVQIHLSHLLGDQKTAIKPVERAYWLVIATRDAMLAGCREAELLNCIGALGSLEEAELPDSREILDNITRSDYQSVEQRSARYLGLAEDINEARYA